MSARVLLSREVGNLTLQAVKGDITDLAVDAITNAANNQLWMGSGVAGAIKRKGGGIIEREAIACGPVPVGTAVATTAGDLPAGKVIHAAVMGPDLRTDIPTVATTTRSVLDLAEEMALGSVAMPLLGTGVGGLDLGEVARSMVGEVSRAAQEGRCARMTVLLVGFDGEAADAVTRAVEDAKVGQSAC
jgi:O-acetyl-ADP-ribose deacetylase (regulator of RNase III)